MCPVGTLTEVCVRLSLCRSRVPTSKIRTTEEGQEANLHTTLLVRCTHTMVLTQVAAAPRIHPRVDSHYLSDCRVFVTARSYLRFSDCCLCTMDPRPPCKFFLQGTCRHGTNCRFAHNTGPPQLQAPDPFHPHMCAPRGPPPQQQPLPLGAPTQAAGAALCKFFLHGKCRDGAQCRFSHIAPADTALPAPPPAAPPPTIIRTPPGVPLCSIDVECVATGVQHHDRAVAQISLVDANCNPRLNLLVRPDVPVASYLTPLTGLTKEQLDQHGTTLQNALATLRAHLPKNAILVGQNIAKDVEWLGLQEGVDYGSMVDLAALLRVWNAQYRSFTYFSQDHYASVWLGFTRTEQDSHDAVADAVLSMRLFHAYAQIQDDARAVHEMGERVLAQKPKPSFAKLHAEWEGCCMGNRQTCKCGAPFFS